MNERIKELLEQAGVKYTIMPKDTVYEKFAELIVRECASLAYDGPGGILEHFGVEEDITTHEIKLTTDPERIRQANYLLNGGR